MVLQKNPDFFFVNFSVSHLYSPTWKNFKNWSKCLLPNDLLFGRVKAGKASSHEGQGLCKTVVRELQDHPSQGCCARYLHESPAQTTAGLKFFWRPITGVFLQVVSSRRLVKRIGRQRVTGLNTRV